MSLKYICIFLSIFFVSCDSDFDGDFEVNGYQEKVVLTGTQSVDNGVRVQLSWSKSLLDNTIYTVIPNAEVQIGNGFESIDLEYQENGFYTSSEQLESSIDYQITAKIDEQFVRSSDYIPADIEFRSLIYQDSFFISDDEIRGKLTIEFEDANETNFYEIQLFQKDNQGKYYACPFSSNYAHITNETAGSILSTGSLNDDFEVIYLSDENFESPSQEVILQVAPRFLDKKILVYLKSLSFNYYQFLLSSNKANIANNDPFAEPVKIFSNIENGIGIFAGYSIAKDSVDIE